MTRIIDKIPFAERRTSRHDELTYKALAIAPTIAHRIWPDSVGDVGREPEYPAGGGFCDLVISDPIPTRKQLTVVEVKTHGEEACGGDILRQLKYYKKKLVESGWSVSLALVVEGDLPEVAACLLNYSGVTLFEAAWVDEVYATTQWQSEPYAPPAPRDDTESE